MQDKFCMFDIAADLTLAGASGTGFAAGVVGTYSCIGGSYDTGPTGVPAAIGPSFAGAGGGTIGGPLIHDLGRGIRLKFYAQIVLAVTSAGAATLEVDFICSAAQDLSAPTTLLQTPAIGKAALVVGYRFRHGSTPGVVPQRFVGSQYVIGGATITAGKITSGLMFDVDDHADVLG